VKLSLKDFPDVWAVLTYSQRYALMRGLNQNFQISGNHTKPWEELPEVIRQELVKLDWNFMLGGVLELLLNQKGEKHGTRSK
jgi:hypothetical protein